MKKLYCFFVCALLTMYVTAQFITKSPRVNNIVSAAVTRAYNWWQYVNPSNVNYFQTFTGINPVNYDTGVVNFSKRTAISLVGWIKPNVDLSIAISDDSLVHLEPLVYLEQLLIRANITDAGIAHLRGLRNLRHFEVTLSGSANYNITDKSMPVIGALKNLEILRLYFCSKITDLGIEELYGLTNLKELTLNGCGITDKSMSFLSKFPKLEILSLATTGITDRGVETIIKLLPSLPALNKIIISNSQVTKRGRDNLIAAKKGLSVIY